MYSVIGKDGQVYGPVNIDTLTSWGREGRISGETNLIDPIDGRVLRANQVPTLEGIFPILPQSAPPVQSLGPSNQNRPGNQYGHIPIQINNYVVPTHAYHPATVAPPGQRSKVVAILLALFLGCFGIHRFYMGHNGTGVTMLLITVLTCGYGGIITAIWALVDLLVIATGGMRDAQNQTLS